LDEYRWNSLGGSKQILREEDDQRRLEEIRQSAGSHKFGLRGV
jgi:hypothetical protein